MLPHVPTLHHVLLGALVVLASVGCASTSSSPATRAAKPPCAAQPPAPLFEYQVEHPVRVASRAPAEAPIAKGQPRQEFVTQFIVRPDATIDSTTFKLLDPARIVVGADGGRRYTPVTDSALIQVAWHRVGAQRFQAAEIRGCTVPQLVQQPIVLPTSGTAGAP